MNRRTLLALGAAVTLAPAALLANPLDYKPGLVAERLEAGETVFLDFKADWCTTCRSQERSIRALKADNPAYEEEVTFIDVNWDEYGDSQLARDLNIPRRSTLVVLKGDEELGRIIAGTSRADIQRLMDIALGAAGS